MRRVFIIILTILIITSATFAVTWVLSAPDKSMRGIWRTEGYGLVIDVGHIFIDVYQITDVSCHRDMRIPSHLSLVKALEGVEFVSVNGRFQLAVSGTLNPIMADRIETLPAACAAPTPNTPQGNFDVLWNAMNEHYSFFDLHGVDWHARQSMRPSLTESYDDNLLFARLSDTLSGLDDGHTYLRRETVDGSGEVFSPSIRPDWHSKRHMVRDNTLAQFTQGLTQIAGTGLQYGWTTPQIGYVYIAHMETEVGLGQSPLDLAHQALFEINEVFQNASGLIFDVRYNPGGSDDIAVAYASHFATQPTVAFSKTTRTATGYTAPFQVSLEPITPQMSQPVIILTGPFTGSAAEIFTLAMGELPQVNTLGTRTSGGLSDIMNYTLPNGWQLGFSHQRYLSAAGEQFEKIGIPPDIAFAVDVEAARNGIDTTLNAAVAWLQGYSSSQSSPPSNPSMAR